MSASDEHDEITSAEELEIDPPEDVIRAVQGIHQCSREDALAHIRADAAAVRAAMPKWWF